MYEIETENRELFGEFDSQEQYVFALGNDHSNGSGTIADLIQKLYMLASTRELMMKDKEEAHSEGMTAPAHDKRDKKGNLECSRIEDSEVPLFEFPPGGRWVARTHWARRR